MTDVILAVLGRTEAASDVLAAAGHLSALAGQANVIALAVDMPPLADPLVAEAVIAEAAAVGEQRDQDRQRMGSLEASFTGWAAAPRQAGIAAQWRRATGAADGVVEEMARRADVIVIAQPAADDDAQTRAGFRAALLHSERPVLVVPPGRAVPFGRIVAIAWRDDGRAAKAVIPALRLLSGAEQVHVVQGTHDGPTMLSPPAVLSDHGIAAHMHVLAADGGFGEALLKKAHALGADMLVMGAYAHSPLREMFFGGVTRFMLEHADCPVLMRH